MSERVSVGWAGRLVRYMRESGSGTTRAGGKEGCFFSGEGGLVRQVVRRICLRAGDGTDRIYPEEGRWGRELD